MAFQNNGKLNGISKQWQNDTFYVSNFFNQVILTTIIYFFIAIRYKKFRVSPNLYLSDLLVISQKDTKYWWKESALADWLSDSLLSL